MTTPTRILHPTDFSACAREALRYALDLALRFGAELHVLYVVDDEQQPDRAPDPTNLGEASLEVRLHETLNRVLGDHARDALDRLHVTYRLGTDPVPAAAIVRYADAHGVDLIVLGTHGRRGLRRLLLGSVAAEVLHESGCDVVTIRACETSALPSGWPHHLLVPLDLSVTSEQVLRRAAAEADRFDASMVLLHVIEPPSLAVFSAGQGGRFHALVAHLREYARERLEQLCTEADLPAGTDLFVDVGPPAQVITDFAEAQEVDLIMLAAHSQHETRQTVLGTVAERVVRRAPCPVWVLKDALGHSTTSPRHTTEHTPMVST